VRTFERQTYPYCSGTLISSTVFLTAAHCDKDGSAVYVTFDSTYTSKSKLYSGTFYTNELYPGYQDDPYDIAVVGLDKPIWGSAPAQLPTLRQFDALKLYRILLSIVGRAAAFRAAGSGARAGVILCSNGAQDLLYPDVEEEQHGDAEYKVGEEAAAVLAVHAAVEKPD
jgi:hypothetical protein